MKTTLIAFLLGGLALPQLHAAPTNSLPRLAGIVRLLDRRVAIVESAPERIGNARQLILGEGQREGDVEVLQIDMEKGTAKLTGRTNVVLSVNLVNQTNPPSNTGFSILLDNADLDPVLKIYSEFKNRTLLRSPRLPTISLTLNDSPTNQAQVALLLEKALAEKGITTIPDGEKFLMVVPESEATTVKPRSSKIKSAAATGDQTELIPPGTINFLSMPLHHAAQIYAAFVGCKLESDPQSPIPDRVIKFQNLTPLSKEECVYALATLFRWQGVKVIQVGQGLVRLVPLSEPLPERNR